MHALDRIRRFGKNVLEADPDDVLRKFTVRYTNLSKSEAKHIRLITTRSDGLGNKSPGIALIVAEYIIDHNNEIDGLEYLQSLIDAPVDVPADAPAEP